MKTTNAISLKGMGQLLVKTFGGNECNFTMYDDFSDDWTPELDTSCTRNYYTQKEDLSGLGGWDIVKISSNSLLKKPNFFVMNRFYTHLLTLVKIKCFNSKMFAPSVWKTLQKYQKTKSKSMLKQIYWELFFQLALRWSRVL